MCNQQFVSNIHTLLVASDGKLWLVPFYSLHDSEKIVVKKYIHSYSSFSVGRM